MPTTDRDAQALTYLARRLRDETHGCAGWDDAGTFANIKAALVGKQLAHAVETVLCHACDPEARTPGAIKRPFTPPKPSATDSTPTPPKASEVLCRICGQRVDECRCGLRETQRPKPGDRAAAFAALRPEEETRA